MPKRQRKKVYVVFSGIKPGIYYDWQTCEAQVKHFSGARFQSYMSREEAERAFHGTKSSSAKPPYQIPCLTVDGACQNNGNGGQNPGEFRAVSVQSLAEGDITRQEVFHSQQPYLGVTNNLMEFMAIVQGLQWLNSSNKAWPLYSDSFVAQCWIRLGHVKKETKDLLQKKNAEAASDLETMENWLAAHEEMKTRVRYWDTARWGEIPADFGRK